MSVDYDSLLFIGSTGSTLPLYNAKDDSYTDIVNVRKDDKDNLAIQFEEKFMSYIDKLYYFVYTDNLRYYVKFSANEDTDIVQGDKVEVYDPYGVSTAAVAHIRCEGLKRDFMVWTNLTVKEGIYEYENIVSAKYEIEEGNRIKIEVEKKITYVFYDGTQFRHIFFEDEQEQIIPPNDKIYNNKNYYFKIDKYVNGNKTAVVKYRVVKPSDRDAFTYTVLEKNAVGEDANNANNAAGVEGVVELTVQDEEEQQKKFEESDRDSGAIRVSKWIYDKIVGKDPVKKTTSAANIDPVIYNKYIGRWYHLVGECKKKSLKYTAMDDNPLNMIYVTNVSKTSRNYLWMYQKRCGNKDPSKVVRITGTGLSNDEYITKLEDWWKEEENKKCFIHCDVCKKKNCVPFNLDGNHDVCKKINGYIEKFSSDNGGGDGYVSSIPMNEASKAKIKEWCAKRNNMLPNNPPHDYNPPHDSPRRFDSPRRGVFVNDDDVNDDDVLG